MGGIEEPKQGYSRQEYDEMAKRLVENGIVDSTLGVHRIDGKRRPTPDEIAERKDKQTSQQIRVFLVLGVPIGFVVAFVVAMATDLGNTGFFCAWAVFAVLIGFFLGSYFETKSSSDK